VWSGNFPLRRSPPPLLQQATGASDGPPWSGIFFVERVKQAVECRLINSAFYSPLIRHPTASQFTR